MLSRIFVVTGAFLLASAAAAAIIVVLSFGYAFAFAPAPLAPMHIKAVVQMIAQVVTIAFIIGTIATSIPALPLILVTELYALRSIALFATAGAVIAFVARAEFVLVLYAKVPIRHANPIGLGSLASNMIYATAGAIAGLLYWRLAGRNAGRGRAMPVSA